LSQKNKHVLNPAEINEKESLYQCFALQMFGTTEKHKDGLCHFTEK
jgi:hypothetical protein